MTWKGLWHLGANFQLWYCIFRFQASSHTWSLSLYRDCGRGRALMAWFRARIAHSLCSFRAETHSSTAGFCDWMIRSGSSLISHLMSAWLGDILIVELTWLLYTAVVIESYLFQSSSWPPVMVHRYCSIHWFLRSDSPSVWGWNAVDRFCPIISVFVSSFPKCDMKCGSLLLMTLVGSPNHL